MATFVLEDLTGTVEALLWPKSFERYRSFWTQTLRCW